MVFPTDASRATTPRGAFQITPRKDKEPVTKGSLQWFQKKHERWLQSPRGKVAALPPSSADKKPLRPTSVQPASPPAASPFSFKPPVSASPLLSKPKPSSGFGTQQSSRNENLPASSVQVGDSAPLSIEPAKEASKDPSSSSLSHRDRLIQFYQKYNPEKVDSVDKTLASYLGKEEVLFRKLEEKYVSGKDGMLPPSGTGPQCFLDFNVDGQSIGRVVVKLYQDKTPLASENFRCLCTGEKGRGRSMKDLCYRNSKIHRVVPGMCVQGGDFTKGNGTGGESIYPPNSEHGDMWGKFKDETPFMMHSRKGLLSMANNGTTFLFLFLYSPCAMDL